MCGVYGRRGLGTLQCELVLVVSGMKDRPIMPRYSRATVPMSARRGDWHGAALV
jgi:hypothetical protein